MELTVHGKQAYVYTGGKPLDTTLPAVVFIHGGELDHSVWVLQTRYFAHHGYTVLAPDLPGHGRSEGPPLETIEAMAAWIIALLDAAKIERAALVGHSMGSLVALEIAGAHPARVTQMALIGSAFPMRVSDALLAATTNDENAAQSMINAWSHAARAQIGGNAVPGLWMMGMNRRLMQRQRAGTLNVDFVACNAYARGAQRAADVRCPTLFIVGARDAMTPPRAAKSLADLIPGARTTLLPGAGHSIAEQPDAILDTLIAFLTTSSST